ncbi:hypothetical protein DQP57_20520 [Mycobacterium colombiense]|uniref:Uncharacterized protein n=1 Tax=Mycobacterium colombiense TaxID=339268 RepID=A0A329LFE9_9MYCO|nr:hypothetical protein DQP57_20520 [Mycobacterium colombiense]
MVDELTFTHRRDPGELFGRGYPELFSGGHRGHGSAFGQRGPLLDIEVLDVLLQRGHRRRLLPPVLAC